MTAWSAEAAAREVWKECYGGDEPPFQSIYIGADHIILLNVYTDKALRCPVRSGEFVRHCLDGGLLERSLMKRVDRGRSKR